MSPVNRLQPRLFIQKTNLEYPYANVFSFSHIACFLGEHWPYIVESIGNITCVYVVHMHTRLWHPLLRRVRVNSLTLWRPRVLYIRPHSLYIPGIYHYKALWWYSHRNCTARPHIQAIYLCTNTHTTWQYKAFLHCYNLCFNHCSYRANLSLLSTHASLWLLRIHNQIKQTKQC